MTRSVLVLVAALLATNPTLAKALAAAPAAPPVVTKIEVAAGTVRATVSGGKTVTVAANGARQAWRVQNGQAVVIRTSASTLLRWEAATGKTVTLAEKVGSVGAFTETKSDRGRTIYVAFVTNPAPETLVLHPALGLVYRLPNSQPNQIRYGMARLDTFIPAAAVGAAKTPRRVIGRETIDFDALVDKGFQIAAFRGTYTALQETPALDGGVLQMRRVLSIDSDGTCTLVSVLHGTTAAATLPNPPPAVFVRRLGSLLTFFAAGKTTTIAHTGLFRPFAPKGGAVAPEGAVYLTTVRAGRGDAGEPLAATISVAREKDGSLRMSRWDLIVYGATPPPFVKVGDSTTAAAAAPFPPPTIAASPTDPESPAPVLSAAPFLGTWRGDGTGGDGLPFTLTLALLPDRTARQSLRTAPAPKAGDKTATASPPVETLETGTWAIVGGAFSVRLVSGGDGKPLTTPERKTFTLGGSGGDDTLTCTAFDRSRYGPVLHLRRVTGE